MLKTSRKHLQQTNELTTTSSGNTSSNENLSQSLPRRRLSSAVQLNQSLSQQQLNIMNKRRGNRVKEVKQQEEVESHEETLQKLWPTYCISIYQDGTMNMDRASHIEREQIENRTLEFQLRPISGIRNHIKRNLYTARLETNVDILKDTDLIHRISSVKTVKRLDLSYNQMEKYPRKLCELETLESLNLTGNNLQETEFPIEIEKYQNLLELILDSNKLKNLPKSITKFKLLSRLSLKSNQINELKYLDSLKRLRELIVDANLLESLDETFKSLEKLEMLSISRNLLISLPPELFHTSLLNLKILDASSNRLDSISAEVFMLPHLESLNLSNNLLNQLPILPTSYFRTVPIFSIDLSSNQIARFYDYLVLISLNVDLSHNRIKVIPLKAMKKLKEKHFRTRSLKIKENPLVEPPIEYSMFGLRELNDYLVESAKKIQLNKGFKIILLGDESSGKTALACALEDFNTQTNLIEHFYSNESVNKNHVESKFIEIHEFLFKCEEEEDTFEATLMSMKMKSDKNSSATTNRQVKLSTTAKPPMVKLSRQKSNDMSLCSNLNPLSTTMTPPSPEKKAWMNINIFDINGSLKQYGHLVDMFIDKSALLILCIDSTKFLSSEPDNIRPTDSQKSLTTSSTFNDLVDCHEAESNLKAWLDIILLKCSKNIFYYVLPVLTKCDKLNKFSKKNSAASNIGDDLEKDENELTATSYKSNIRISSAASFLSSNLNNINNLSSANLTSTSTHKFVLNKVENIILNHINERLEDIKFELKKIESLAEISTSQSDRLKQLVQTRTSLNPDIAKRIMCVSSIKMDGISSLTSKIREIVYNNARLFPDVNKKVPSFWIDIENYSCNTLSSMSYSKVSEDDSQSQNRKINVNNQITAQMGAGTCAGSLSASSSSSNSLNQQNLTMLFVNYKDYKEKLVDKFGMSHLIESITKYMHTSGRILWFSETESLKSKVFLQPYILFDMLYALFREKFSENFKDHHLQTLRAKLVRNYADFTKEYIKNLQKELLEKGSLKLDLLKLLWYPILVIDSTQLLTEICILMSYYFKIG